MKAPATAARMVSSARQDKAVIAALVRRKYGVGVSQARAKLRRVRYPVELDKWMDLTLHS